jgi:hypothetical protein
MALESAAALWVAGGAALGVLAVHLLSWRRPQPRWLPTARFVPAAAQRALSRRLRPSDLLLLSLRLGAVLSIGLAVAGPSITVRRSGIARVILADRSRAVASVAAVRDSVERLADDAATARVILFDSLPAGASDAAWRDSSGSGRRGTLDAALIVGIREAVALRSRFDSVELVLVSPVIAEEVSEGTARIVAAYGRPVRHVPVQARPPSAPPVLTSASWPVASDPVGAALRLATDAPRSWLRVVRGVLSAADSAHAAGGGLVLHWPEAPAARPSDEGVLSASGAVVGAFARLSAPPGTPVAWWSDGRPAAAQEPLGTGCVRHVAIGLPVSGDVVLRPAFQRLVRDLATPCDWRDARALAPSELAWLTPSAGALAADRRGGMTAPVTRRLLLALALLALAAEWWLRRRGGRNLRYGPVPGVSGGRA